MFLPIFDDENTSLRGNNFFAIFPEVKAAENALSIAFRAMYSGVEDDVKIQKDKPLIVVGTSPENRKKLQHEIEDSKISFFNNGVLLTLPICDSEGKAIMENVMLAYTLEKNAKHSVSENPLL